MIKSSLSGIKYGVPHYKYLGQDKTNAFKISTGCFTAMMILSPESLTDVQWWYNKINRSKNNITKGEPVIKISSDESSFGWGAVWNNIRTGGAFNLEKTMKRKRRAMMQMQNHAKNKLNWNGCLTKNVLQKLFLSFNFNQRWTYLHQGSMLNCQCLFHTIQTQRLSNLMLFQYHGGIYGSMHFLLLLQLKRCYIK